MEGSSPSEVALSLRVRPFWGTEAEGPRKGQKVLFIPGVTTPVEFDAALLRATEQNRRIDRVYFGAGNVCEKLDLAALRHILSLFDPRVVDVETVESGLTVSKLREKGLTVISHNRADLHWKSADYWKRVDKEKGLVIWKGHDGFEFVTSLDDPLFAQDEFV